MAKRGKGDASAAIPAVAGLAVGMALVVLFGLFFSPFSSSSTLALPARKSGIIDEIISIKTPPNPRVGQALDIVVRTSGKVFSCATVHAAVTNANTSEVVWDSGTTLTLCDPDTTTEGRQVDTNWALGGKYADSENQGIGSSPVVIREAGRYTISAEFDGLKTNRTIEVMPQVVDVAIMESASVQSSGRTYDPVTVRVFLGMNNTVRWTNKDVLLHSIAADNKGDPDFYTATTDAQGGPRALQPNGSFEFTFTRAGKFGYHGEPGPWMRGTVVVMPSRPSASELKTKLSEKDAEDIVAKDILAGNPGAQIAEYPLSNKFPVMLYYFAPSGDRIVIDHGENNTILGRCNPDMLACYPRYDKLDLSQQNGNSDGGSGDRLAYAVQVLVKADKSARYGDSAYYLVGANTGRIIYSSKSEVSSLEKAGAGSLCGTPESAGQKDAPREPSMLPSGYHCAYKDSMAGEGVFVYWNRDLQSMPYELAGPESAGIIKMIYQKIEEGEEQVDPQAYQQGVDESNQRGFPARLTRIDGSVAIVNEYCDVCGTLTHISYDYNGYHYSVASNLPSTMLVPMLRSMP